jgi:hypothetical protein
MKLFSTGTLAVLALSGSLASAHGIKAKAGNAPNPTFDIVNAQVTRKDRSLVFKIKVAGKAGTTKPTKSGALGGANVFSYVWPTSMDSSVAGFESDQGILALAVTAHPDFDDTPMVDENGDGDMKNDGDVWHSHWVVLVKDDSCGVGALKVKDIPDGAKPKLPATWPGLPILIDSPGYVPSFDNDTVRVSVPMPKSVSAGLIKFDGVTAGLRVSDSVHAPLLCVKDVLDVASGDLSLPGKVGRP